MFNWIKNFLGIKKIVTKFLGTRSLGYTHLPTGRKGMREYSIYKVVREEDGEIVRLYSKGDYGEKIDLCLIAYKENGTLTKK